MGHGISRSLAILLGLLLIVALGSSVIGGAIAASPCADSRVTNAFTRASADGDIVYGSSCSDRIVVTSPEVEEIVAGDGADVIFANPDVEVVDGGEGDDVIHGELPETVLAAAASSGVGAKVPLIRRMRRGSRNGSLATISSPEPKNCTKEVSCYGGEGSQELIGSSGNDKIFGQRGNDILKGNAGNDQLFGGIGDESLITGNAGNDMLSGGLGTDVLDGGAESDLVHGDGTIDTIEDSGGGGTDTLSFATAVAPGFHGAVGPSGFPADSDSEERGVYVRLDGVEGLCGKDPEGFPLESCNNDARYGGGADQINVSGFEDVIGSPFADVVVGSNGANRIYGGGGADAIYGKEGNDEIFGGADGDFIKGEAGTDTAWGQGGTNNCSEIESENECSGSGEAVKQRDRTKISVGLMVTKLAGGEMPGGLSYVELYVTGSTSRDVVTTSFYFSGPTGHVLFVRGEGSAAFDNSSDAQTSGCEYFSTTVDCTLPKPVDAIVMAGMSGNDELTFSPGEQFWETMTPILLGGEGNDVVTGSGYTEDLLVDGNGSGEDTLRSGGNDDALINNEGKDTLEAGNGNDLLLSAVNCEGDVLDGARSSEGDGAAVNSSSWAKYPEGSPGIVADLQSGKAGTGWSGSTVVCGSGTVGTLLRLDDLEGSNNSDELYGDANANNIFARKGADAVFGREGSDRIEVAGDATIDNGGGGAPSTKPGDVCVVDANEKSSFSGCETFPAP